MFVRSMKTITTGSKVWTRQSHKGESGAICASANRTGERCESFHRDCLFCKIDNLHLIFNNGEHIFIGVFNFQSDSIRTVFLVQRHCDISEFL